MVGRLREVALQFVGPASLGLIVVGIWGRFGWEWGCIAAGLPPAAFYLAGEAAKAWSKIRAGQPEGEE